MDYFENVIKTLLEGDGYWVRQSFKVNLTKEEKRQVGKHSIPRPEIDLLAYKPNENRLLAFEAKSFLDSSGVRLSCLSERHEIPEGKYKLFTCENYRKVVFKRLKLDLIECGMGNDSTEIVLGLAAGKVYQSKSAEIKELFSQNSWLFWSPEDIRSKVIDLAKRGYENEPAIITAKILMRQP
ncbi:hypothetical protein [Ectopseudomonas khazarica]|uniref:hypothetical protein n=1 Tax=Ectopseudomonas khazarica TaxID=2502979 RepID=UPI0006455FE0